MVAHNYVKDLFETGVGYGEQAIDTVTEFTSDEFKEGLADAGQGLLSGLGEAVKNLGSGVNFLEDQYYAGFVSPKRAVDFLIDSLKLSKVTDIWSMTSPANSSQTIDQDLLDDRSAEGFLAKIVRSYYEIEKRVRDIPAVGTLWSTLSGLAFRFAIMFSIPINMITGIIILVINKIKNFKVFGIPITPGFIQTALETLERFITLDISEVYLLSVVITVILLGVVGFFAFQIAPAGIPILGDIIVSLVKLLRRGTQGIRRIL